MPTEEGDKKLQIEYSRLGLDQLLWRFSATTMRTVETRGDDYCLLDTFVATCESGSWVRIREALLGRMRRSRCLTGSMQLGCFDDVTHIVQSR